MTSQPSNPPARGGLLVAVCAAVLAVAAAAVAAAGPAKGERAEYEWPPATLPAESPSLGWYAPLPLLNRVPESLEVRVPCDLSPPLGGEGASATVIATARRPESTDALRISLEEGSLRVGVGVEELAAVPWPASCPLQVDASDGEVRLPARTVPLEIGTPGDMPIVTGLFSELDLREGTAPEIVVRTRAYATSWTARQTVAGVLAALLAAASLLLLVRSVDGLRRPRLRAAIGSAWRARDVTDAVVVGGVLVWWIVGPALSDDGWIWAQLRVLGTDGIDSIYYNNWGIGFPVGYWHAWLEHWVIGSTSDLVVMRLPSLALVLAAWPLCRWCVQAALGERPPVVVRWVLAGAFLAGATAWLITLRSEPTVAFLTLVGLAAMVSFARRPRLLPVTIAVLAALLAATAHPVGMVAVAPILASVPELVRWLRSSSSRLWVAGIALVLASCALTVVLLTVDSDLTTRLDGARLVSEEELHDIPWWREYVRYEDFDINGGETAVRRLSLLLLLLSVAALVMRRRSVRTGVLLLPARSVGVALVLLAFVSSKWPWHFGGLATLGAVAIAAEAARLVREADGSRWALVRLVGALAAVVAAVFWSWEAVGPWAKIDLQEAHWAWFFGIWGRYWWLAALVLVATAVVAALLWQGRRLLPTNRRLSLATAWAIAVGSLGAVGVTTAIIVYDAAVSPWGQARQNLDALRGEDSCGLAHQLEGESGLVEWIAEDETVTLSAPVVSVYFPCATIPAVKDGLVEMPRLVAFEASLGPWPLDTRHGPFAAVRDLYAVTPFAVGPSGIEVHRVDDDLPGLARADAARVPLSGETGSGAVGAEPQAPPGEELADSVDHPLHLGLGHSGPDG